MGPIIADALQQLRQEGPRRFARWDSAAFEAIAAGPAMALFRALEEQLDRDAVTTAYLSLAQQGVGTGSLRRAASEGVWSGFLERCLIGLVPELLPAVPAGRRVPLLVTLWNLAEGLRREPAWLDNYVTARATDLTDLADLEGFLGRTLAPVLSPAPPAAWRGPFAVTVLDLRPLHDEFLPGAVALAGPTLLRVDDRRLPGVQAAVLWRPGGKSELLGLTTGLGQYEARPAAVAVEFYDGKVSVAGHVVAVPALRDCHHHAVARAGFVAACAVDSQRLWIVESP